MRITWVALGLILAMVLASVGLRVVERYAFPVWEPNYFNERPGRVGPYEVSESDAINNKSIEGERYEISLFAPKGENNQVPGFIWLTGSNVQPYYHQSLHETLASWGYLVIVPEVPPFSFTDLSYHKDILSLASEAVSMAISGELGVEVAEDRIAAGGFSTGASLAAFLGAKRSEIAGLVYWAPSGSPYWLGLSSDKLYPEVDQPALYVLGELDNSAPPVGEYPEKMQKLMPKSPVTIEVIEKGVHHYFQQPTGADKFSADTEITRFEQQGKAIDSTRKWLNNLFGVD